MPAPGSSAHQAHFCLTFTSDPRFVGTVVGTVGAVVGAVVGTLMNYNRSGKKVNWGLYLVTPKLKIDRSYCNLQELLQPLLQPLLQFLPQLLQISDQK